jgi:predicted MPP superfamily phosphohydrolase
MTYVWIFVGLLLMFFLWSFLEQKRIVSSKYIIKARALGKDNKSLSFIVLADIHNKSFGKNNHRLLKKVLEEKPDFVIIAGDLITKRKPCLPGSAYNLIKDLSELYPVYYALGNHEQSFEDMAYSNNESSYKKHISLYESWTIFKEKLNQLGVYLLDNKSIMIHYNDSKLTISGFSIASGFYNRGKPLKLSQDDIINSIGKRNREGYQIMIAHNPEYFMDYVQWGADLILSGHVHGGLVRLPFIGGIISPQVKLFPKYDGGQYSKNNQHMIVSRGLGSHSFMPRFLNPPELIVIKLNNEQAPR